MKVLQSRIQELKYSHFFITQEPLKTGSTLLQPGEYPFGYQRINNDVIRVSFYRAFSGEGIGTVDAHVNRKSSMVRSLLISPPLDGRGSIQVGRFFFEYKLANASGWMHDVFPALKHFSWQRGYAAFAVSQSNVEDVRRYISRQKQHHRKISSRDEFIQFLQSNRVEFDERYV